MASKQSGKLTLPLLVWGVCTVFGGFVLLALSAYFLGGESRSSLYWTFFLFGIPALIVSVLTGLASSLGAYIGKRLTSSDDSASRSSRRAASIGAGLGAVLVGGLPLGYFISIFAIFGEPMPFAFALPLAAIILFTLFGGFTAVWLRRSFRRIG